MRTIKWRVLAVALCLIGATFVQATASPGNEPHIIDTSIKHGAPAVDLEWAAQQLIAVEGIYTLTGTSPVPFNGLTVGWLVSDLGVDPKSFEIAIRTRKDEAPWDEWVHFPGDIGPSDSPSGLYWTYLYTPSDLSDVHTDYEIKIRPPAGRPLTFVRVGVVDHSAALITAPLREPDAITALGAPTNFNIIPRRSWLGAEHSWNVSQINITHAIVHHTVTRNVARTELESMEHMRFLRSLHINRGWADIGYNFVIDREGRIFQGTYNPWLYRTDVRGIHAGFSNGRSVGIALMGQFQPNEPPPTPPVGNPTDAARRSLEQLLAWRFQQRSLDPIGSASIPVTIRYGRNPDGSYRRRSEGRAIDRIAGHRDVSRTTYIRNRGTVPERADTACPGDNLQVLLPTIRTNVRNLIPR